MKIGFAGNINNHPFALARAMQRLGHEVVFVVDSDYHLHRPECRYAEISRPYPEWIHDFSGTPDKYWKYILFDKSMRSVVAALADCDALILNGLWPIVGPHLSKPYIAMLAGSDLEIYADTQAMLRSQADHLERSRPSLRWLKGLVYREVVRRQRSGIRRANGFIAAIPGLIPNIDTTLLGIAPQGKHLFGLMVDVREIQPVTQPNNRPLKILNAARLTWKMPVRPGTSELDYKGTDILIRGLAKYLAQGCRPIRLTLVRKGLDVEATAALVGELGIGDSIDWKDEMTQTELMEEYRKSDVIADQFANSIVSIAGLDAMAMGRPVLANGRPEIMEPFIGEPSPVCQAATPDQVCDQLTRLADDEFRQIIGQRSRAYVEKHHATEIVAARCLRVLAPN